VGRLPEPTKAVSWCRDPSPHADLVTRPFLRRFSGPTALSLNTVVFVKASGPPKLTILPAVPRSGRSSLRMGSGTTRATADTTSVSTALALSPRHNRPALGLCLRSVIMSGTAAVLMQARLPNDFKIWRIQVKKSVSFLNGVDDSDAIVSYQLLALHKGFHDVA
jgi:hypothetical protein